MTCSPSLDGVLVIDKPAGLTSHDVVGRMRRQLGERRIGHTGTLDPAATGVLPLVIGRATRLARFFSTGDKAYDAVVRLGTATDTADADGVPVGEPFTGVLPGRDVVRLVLDEFRGTFQQQPPAYSAKKIGGRRSYAVARARKRAEIGAAIAIPEHVLPQPVPVTVHELEIVEWRNDTMTIHLEVSTGFYVRSLAHDLGTRLGTGAHLVALRRTRSGSFGLDQAIRLADAELDADRARAAVIPMSRALSHLPVVVLTAAGTARAARGCELGAADFVMPAAAGQDPGAWSDEAWIRLEDDTGGLVAVAQRGRVPGLLHPRVVLV